MCLLNKITIADLNSEDFNPFYQSYIDNNGGNTLLESLSKGFSDIDDLFLKLTEAKLQNAYAPLKWTIAEVLIHLADTERIFQYRSLCFSRGDNTALPGFDENAYVPNSNAAHRNLASIKEELIVVRNATLSLFKSFSSLQLNTKGLASGSEMSVAAIGFIISGHLTHHFNIIETRYFKK